MNSQVLQKSLEYINSWLDYRYQEGETVGFVVAISHKGKILLNTARGFANTEREIKMQPENLFRIASHSKTFTAVAILQLAEKGKLRIDDYAVHFLPWLKEHQDKRWKKVTLRQLLSHSAGVIRDGLEADYWQLQGQFPDLEGLKKIVLGTDLVLDTNIQLKYSNIGYGLLGQVIEAVSQQPYNHYVTEKIIRPLQLKNTGPELTADVEPRIVTGYTRRDAQKKRRPIANVLTNALSPATGFYSNTADLSVFYRALRVGSGKLLSDESKKEMQRTQWRVHNTNENEEYGLGLTIEYFSYNRLIGHGGGFPGQQTFTLYDPANDLVIAVLTNCLASDLDAITYGALSIINYFQGNTGRPKTGTERLAGRFMDLWGITDIVTVGSKILSVYPGWRPFNNPEELSFVDEKTLKVTKTNGYHSADELVHFKFNQTGQVTSVNYCGTTMLPEKDYLARQESEKVVGLQ